MLAMSFVARFEEQGAAEDSCSGSDASFPAQKMAYSINKTISIYIPYF